MNTLQYTIRNIPKPVDQVLRKRAKLSGKSFNATILDVLIDQTMPAHSSDTDFNWLFGAGKDLIGNEFDEAISEQSKAELDKWK